MAHLAESLRTISIMLRPFLTESPDEICQQLGITDDSLQTWDSLYERGIISAGTNVQKRKPIFPRLDMEDEIAAIKALMTPAVQQTDESLETKAEIDFDDFIKLDLSVGEIVRDIKIKNTILLLKFQNDFIKLTLNNLSDYVKFC